MKGLLLLLGILCFTLSNAQKIGGPCEGCEAIFEFGSQQLSNVDTLPGFDVQADKLKVTGTIYKADGVTPASNVLLYVYHTNDKGIYPTRGNEKGWARRHGYIRGWIKTDDSGHYTFYTFRPAPYPNRRTPVHIHMIVKEPEKNEYWIDSIEFEDDPLLMKTQSARKSDRGGNGVVSVRFGKGGMAECARDIILGLNIPNYK